MRLAITLEEKILRELDKNDEDDANDLLSIVNGSLESHMAIDQMDRTRIFMKHKYWQKNINI